MKIQTLIQHVLSTVLGAYLVVFFLGIWNHFKGYEFLILGVLLIFLTPFYKILEESK